MTRKFLFCFPLRLGNLVFGYIVITIALAVMTFNLYKLGLCVVSNSDEIEPRFKNFDRVDNLFGAEKKDLLLIVVMLYHCTYIVISFFLFIFSALFTCGTYKANGCLVTTFFVYSFLHLFLTVGLMVWEALTAGWVQLGLILAFDLLLIICLFSVKYLMEAIRTGCIYSRPGEVYYKY